MSKTFAERFKGRIEEFPKDGIHKIISSTGQPVNLVRQPQDRPFNSESLRAKESQRFSKNAQTNILDFEKNYQTVMRPASIPGYYYETDPGFLPPQRGVYSAFEAPRHFPNPNTVPCFNDYTVHKPQLDLAQAAPYPGSQQRRSPLSLQTDQVPLPVPMPSTRQPSTVSRRPKGSAALLSSPAPDGGG